MLEVQDLERHVNAAVLELIVTTFHETCEPMDRLVRAALKPSGVSVYYFNDIPIMNSLCQLMR